MSTTNPIRKKKKSASTSISSLTDARFSDGAHVWEEIVHLPTYPHGEPCAHPMFLSKRVYQGSSGAVYPFPVVETVGGELENRPYRAVFLENRYLKIMLLPELGGRVHMAYDKQHDYHFVYFNRVIKPALVGLAGPWISGGIEFNWPQHHRPSTFLSIESSIETREDGSACAIMGETDRMNGTRSVARFSLHPDCARLQIDVTLTNPTHLPQTFLWWANPAVAAGDDYQSVFPPDVHAVMDHGKRDVSEFPVARGEYYKVDYSQGPDGGTDISRYRNIPVPTSYMAYHSEFDFMGGYDHGRQMGLLHVANHHLVPGKKQWTWGHGDFGVAWDRELTDEDGPYVELMVGAFTDNQPDFSWLEPGETKRFTQYFMPYKQLGMIRNADEDLRLTLERTTADSVRVAVGCSANLGTLSVTLSNADGTDYWNGNYESAPETVLDETVPGPADVDDSDLVITIRDADGKALLSYQPDSWTELPVPDPAEAIGPPETLSSVEACLLAGQHLEQYRHATREPSDYYLEGLRRDPGDWRCQNALGVLWMRRGRFVDAQACFETAIERQLSHNPNPADGDAYHNLGLSLVLQGQDAKASNAFWKATWNGACRAKAYFALAECATRSGDYQQALELVEQSERNDELKLVLLRVLGRAEQARKAANLVVSQDPLSAVAHYELHRLGDSDAKQRLTDLFSGDEQRFLNLAFSYHRVGLFADVQSILEIYLDESQQPYPVVLYLLCAALLQQGEEELARQTWEQAAAADPELCFPNTLDELRLLEQVLEVQPDDALAAYLLGNFWCARKQHAPAIDCWERSAGLNPDQPIAWRNLGLAYYNAMGDQDKALEAFERAFALDTADARVLYELDQLRKQLGASPAERLAKLQKHESLLKQRDDLYIEWVSLLNSTGDHDKALCLLQERVFHPWEGGEGRSTGQYRTALVQLALEDMSSGELERADERLKQALEYPHNLGEGKLVGQKDNDIHYWRGKVLAQMGRDDEARQAWASATEGNQEMGAAQYYNDQPPEMLFYAALALRQLGNQDEARNLLLEMQNFAEAHADDEPLVDYFAVSLPDFLVFEQDLALDNRIQCTFLEAIATLGLGETVTATALFDEVLAKRPDHQAALLLVANPFFRQPGD